MRLGIIFPPTDAPNWLRTSGWRGTSGVVVKPGVGGEKSIAVVFVERAVKLVGAALGDERDLTAGRTSEVRAFAGDGDAEFLHRIERNGEDGVESGIGGCAIGVRTLISAKAGGGSLCDKAGVLVVVDVGAVESDVVLIAAGSENFAAGGDAGLQAEQFDDVARLQAAIGGPGFRRTDCRRWRRSC